MGSRSPCAFNISLLCYGYNYWFCDVSSFPYIISSAVSVVIICLISHFDLFSLVSHVSCSCFSALSASLWSPVPPSLVSPVFGHHSVLYFGPYHQQRCRKEHQPQRNPVSCKWQDWLSFNPSVASPWTSDPTSPSHKNRFDPKHRSTSWTTSCTCAMQ